MKTFLEKYIFFGLLMSFKTVFNFCTMLRKTIINSDLLLILIINSDLFLYFAHKIFLVIF